MNESLAILLGGLIGTVLHETARAAAAMSRGLKVKRVVFNRKGIGVVRERGTELDTAVIALAGPLVNLALAIAFWNLPGFRTANLILFAVNLLPLRGSDGYKAVMAVRNCWRAL